MSQLICVLAAALYLYSGIALTRGFSAEEPDLPRLGRLWWPALLAALAHAAAIGLEMFGSPDIHFGFGPSLSLLLFFAVLFTLVESRLRSVSGLLGLVLLAAAVAVLAPVAFPGAAWPAESWTTLFRIHLLLAFSACSFMTIAVPQAVLVQLMRRQLKRPAGRRRPFIANLPGLVVMERILYRIVLCGFVCLTLVLLVGALTTYQYHGYYFVFDHKTVVTWLSWIVFAALMYGRYRLGWRDRRALTFFWLGYATLIAAYLAYRLVIDLFIS